MDYPKYSGGRYASAQEQAKKNSFGIWKMQEPISPYCHKHPKSNACSKNGMYEP